MGESLVKMQQKTSLPTEVTSSKIIEETTTRSTLDSAKVFGRKFSASLDNFASLSLRESRVEKEEEEEEVGDSETFRACNKRKREETPLQEVSMSKRKKLFQFSGIQKIFQLSLEISFYRNTCSPWPVALRQGWAWRM